MFEVEKKFRIHDTHVKPFMDRVVHLGFELVSTQDQRTIYMATKNPVVKVRTSRSQLSDVKIKTEYSLIRRTIHRYNTVSGKEREIPNVEEEKISRFIANSIIQTTEKSYLPTVIKLRRTFKKKEQPKGITSDNTHLLTIDFDDVQAVGNENLYVEIKMLVAEVSDRAEAMKTISLVVDQLQPFLGEFEGEPYLKIIQRLSKSL